MKLNIEAFAMYLKNIKGSQTNTVKSYVSDLRQFEEYLNLSGKNTVKDIKLSDIVGFVENQTDCGTSTKVRKQASIKTYIRWEINYNDVLMKDPTAALEPMKREHREPKVMTLKEAKALIAAAKNNLRDEAIITVFLNTGLRLSELANIRIADIQEDVLRIVGKGNKERVIVLNGSCMKAIYAYMEVRKGTSEYLFTSQMGTRLSERTIQRTIKKYMEQAGLNENYTVHTLRHTAATLLYNEAGVDIRTLQEILGHSSITTTQIYTHIGSEKVRSAMTANPLNA